MCPQDLSFLAECYGCCCLYTALRGHKFVCVKSYYYCLRFSGVFLCKRQLFSGSFYARVICSLGVFMQAKVDSSASLHVGEQE